MKMNATVLGKMGVCGPLGIKKWITTKKHMFLLGKSRVSGCGNRILKDRFTKMSVEIIKNSPQTRIKSKKKCVRERRKRCLKVFGEMESYKEINELAENLRQEGDADNLRAMAEENGIPSDFVEMYLDGMIPELCDPVTAAIGKLDAECRELKPQEIMGGLGRIHQGLCMEHEEAALQVRAREKA